MNTLRLREGIFGGIVAGIVMAMVAMMYTLLTQGDLLAPVKQMGALLFPTDSGSALSLVTGLMVHMVTSAVFGIAFVLLARLVLSSDRPLSTIGVWPFAIAAMMYILVEWAIASYVILPAVDRPLLATFSTVGGFVAHAMYGIVLGWWLVWRAAAAPIRVTAGTHQHHAA